MCTRKFRLTTRPVRAERPSNAWAGRLRRSSSQMLTMGAINGPSRLLLNEMLLSLAPLPNMPKSSQSERCNSSLQHCGRRYQGGYQTGRGRKPTAFLRLLVHNHTGLPASVSGAVTYEEPASVLIDYTKRVFGGTEMVLVYWF